MPELPFEMPRTSAEKAVLEKLKENGRAWHVRDLVKELRMNERLVRQCIANLVELGEPILSDSRGYYFPRTAEDVERACGGYMKRVLSLLRRIKCLKENETYEELLGHVRLELLAPSKPRGEDVEEK